MGRKSNQELIHSECGNYVLYKREGCDTSKYYARIRVPVTNEWRKYSTQTTELLQAKRFAEKKLAEIEFKQDHSIPLDDKRFAEVADVAIQEMEALIKSKVGKQSYIDYIRCLNKYKDFFGNKHLARITSQDIVEFQNWLSSHIGRKPNRSTFNTYFAAIKRVFDLAIRNRWVDQKLIPVIKNEGVKTKRRPDFSGKEILALRKFLKGYAETTTKTPSEGNDKSKGGVKKISIEIRQFLYNYVDFILFTGMRPGREMKCLKWSHISEEELDGESRIVIRLPSGKTGARTIIAGDHIRECLSRIAFSQIKFLKDQETREQKLKSLERELQQQIQTATTQLPGETKVVVLNQDHQAQKPSEPEPFRSDLYKMVIGADVPIFVLSNGKFPKDLPGAFERALELAKLLINAQGQKRSLYSIRHAYATIMLVHSKIDIHTLARNMGTSVQMIEKHYSHLSVLQKHKQLSPLTEGILTAAGHGDFVRTINEEL